MAARPHLFRPPVRPGPPGPRATWDSRSTLRPAGSAWLQPPLVGTLHGPLPLPGAPCTCRPTQAAGCAGAPRRPPRRPSTPPALCAQLIANLGPPEQLGVRRCRAHGLHLNMPITSVKRVGENSTSVLLGRKTVACTSDSAVVCSTRMC